MTTSALIPAPLRDSVRRRRELFDRATGLPGPVLLLDRVEMGLAHAKRRSRLLGVFSIDPGLVRHQSSHLREIGQRLEAMVRPDDTVACDGAGHLVVVCHNLDHDALAARVAQRLVDAVAAPCLLGVALGCAPIDAPGLIAQAMNRAVPRASFTSRAVAR